MSDVVVDTDVVSFGFRRDSRFAFYHPHLRGNRAITSFMTLAELRYWGIARKWGQTRRQQLDRHLKTHFVIYPVSGRLCTLWAELTFEARSKGRVLHAADAWIAATAVALNAPLLTHNAADFECLDGLHIISDAKP